MPKLQEHSGIVNGKRYIKYSITIPNTLVKYLNLKKGDYADVVKNNKDELVLRFNKN